MARCGSAAGLVTVLWLRHGLPPSEILDCHPVVLAATVASVYRRELDARDEATGQTDRQSFQRMHAAIHGNN